MKLGVALNAFIISKELCQYLKLRFGVFGFGGRFWVSVFSPLFGIEFLYEFGYMVQLCHGEITESFYSYAMVSAVEDQKAKATYQQGCN